MKRIVVYEQDQSGEFEAVFEVWDGDRFKPVVTERSDTFIYAVLNCRTEAIFQGAWTETHEGGGNSGSRHKKF